MYEDLTSDMDEVYAKSNCVYEDSASDMDRKRRLEELRNAVGTKKKKVELPPMHAIQWGRQIQFETHKFQRMLTIIRHRANQQALKKMQERFHRDRIVESEERYIRQ